MPERPLVTTESAQEFFRAAVVDALERERVVVGPMTEYYVVNLLLSQTGTGYHPDEPLSVRLCTALERKMPLTERTKLLREVGDAALVISGLWWERDEHPRRPRYNRFHHEAGKVAYRQLGMLGDRRTYFGSETFCELSEKFGALVDVLVRFGTAHSLASARDVLRLYHLWQETHSRHAARVLCERGLYVGATGSSTPS